MLLGIVFYVLLLVGDVRFDGLLLLDDVYYFDVTDCVGRDGTQLCCAECELLMMQR